MGQAKENEAGQMIIKGVVKSNPSFFVRNLKFTKDRGFIISKDTNFLSNVIADLCVPKEQAKEFKKGDKVIIEIKKEGENVEK